MTFSNSEHFINMTEYQTDESMSDFSDDENFELNYEVLYNLDNEYSMDLSYGYIEEIEQEDIDNFDEVMSLLTTHENQERELIIRYDETIFAEFHEDMIEDLQLPMKVGYIRQIDMDWALDNIIENLEYFDCLSFHITDKIIHRQDYMSTISLAIHAIKSRNQQIFKEVQEKIQEKTDKKYKKESFLTIEPELLAKSLHPSRIEKLIKNYGFKGMLETVC